MRYTLRQGKLHLASDKPSSSSGRKNAVGIILRELRKGPGHNDTPH